MLHAIGPILVPEFLPLELREDSPLAFARPSLAAAGSERQPGNEETARDPDEGHGDVAFRSFIANQLRSGTRSLYADSIKYMERILLTDVLSYTNGNQSQAALLLGITRGCLRSKLRMHGMMISSSVAVQSSAR